MTAVSDTLRFDILEANIYAAEIVSAHGYDVLDLHYHFRGQTKRQVCLIPNEQYKSQNWEIPSALSLPKD